MIDQTALTADLRKLLDKDLLPLLGRRAKAEPEIDAALKSEHAAAKSAGRTSSAFEVWRDDYLTQVGVAWVLGCVFIRFMEDNGLVNGKDGFPRIAGPGSALKQAQDQHEAHFRQHPTHSDRDYLLAVFKDAGKLRGCHELFSKEHNPLWAQGGVLMDADAASRLIAFFQQLDSGSDKAELVHDFTDQNLGTRFLGDLYQNLSEAARKKYALLQTPVFVEEFILDRTLEPAIKEFGLCDQKGRDLSAQKKPIPSDHLIRMIDPTVGSGHFLLGGFERLFAHWQKQEPMTEPAVLAERCLNSLFGVDLNPYAANIARFRLLVAALKACGIKRLREARDFRVNIAVGDSLLHGSFAGGVGGGELFEAQVRTDSGSAYATSAEDLEVLRRFLMPHRYHVVVGNPPYITVKDAALSEAYRRRYGSCHRKYALSVPFFERFFDLAVAPEGAEVSKAGFVGKITANSFMKREFGKKLIETYLPRWDLTHVIDTSGAYIPGHGTPTVILYGRHRAPVGRGVRAVLGIRGEPATPEDPATAKVWSAILDQIDRPGSTSEFVSVTDTLRESFHTHPWSIGGGGAAELKEQLDEGATTTLDSCIHDLGRTTHTGEDDVFYISPSAANTGGFGPECVPLVIGEDIRDFTVTPNTLSIFPYDKTDATPVPVSPQLRQHFWQHRAVLRQRLDFGNTPEQRGLRWFDHSMFFPSRYNAPLSIAFAFVATHNHFVLDRGGKVFKQSAPVIKLPAGASEEDHLALLGVLNSAAACFWMQQVFHNKGGPGGGCSKDEKWHDFYEFAGTKLGDAPVPWAANDRSEADNALRTSIMGVARDIDTLAQARAQFLPASLLAASAGGGAVSAGGGGAAPEGVSALLQAARTIVQLSRTTVQTSRTTLQPDRTMLQAERTILQLARSILQTTRTTVQAGRTTLQPGRREAGTDHSPESPRAGSPDAAPAAPQTILSRADLDAARGGADLILQQMIALQEELDWLVYRAYGLLEDTKAEHQPAADAPPINLGERAFEIVMARKMEAGTLQTEWFRRHGSTPITQIPAHPPTWPAAYKKVVEHRIALIEAGAKQNKDIALIEQPEYKRRWNTEKWEEMEERALREWLLDRLEWGMKTPSAETTDSSRSGVWEERDPRLMTAARLADRMRGDDAFKSVAALYAKSHAAPDELTALVQQLIAAESVPFLPVLRYKDKGLQNRQLWERTWTLQREEDRLEALREQARAKIKAAEAAVIEQSLSEERDEIKTLDSKLAELRATLVEKYLPDQHIEPGTPPEKVAEAIGRDKVSACRVLVDQIEGVVSKLKEARADFDRRLPQLCRDDEAWQRASAELEAVPPNPEIEVPPRYTSKEFQTSDYWRLRGKLDVPKERFVSFPHCGPDGDQTTLVTWAGFDHRQQAKAVTTYYTDRKANAGWEKSRFIPLLAGLLELLPWLKQWHNQPDADGHKWAEVIEGFIDDEARELCLTVDQIRAWTPPAAASNRGRKGGRKKKADADETAPLLQGDD